MGLSLKFAMKWMALSPMEYLVGPYAFEDGVLMRAKRTKKDHVFFLGRPKALTDAEVAEPAFLAKLAGINGNAKNNFYLVATCFFN